MIFDDFTLAVIAFCVTIAAYLFCFGGLFTLFKRRLTLRYHGIFKYPSFNAEYTERVQWDQSVHESFLWLQYPNPVRSVWIEEQNICTDNYFSSLKTTREKFSEQYKNLMCMSKQGTPFQRGKYYFYFKKDSDQNNFVLWRSNFDADVREILNPNTDSRIKDDVVVSVSIVDDGSIIAYTVANHLRTMYRWVKVLSQRITGIDSLI